ncbi:hypothetical protein [Alishewanella longhuensis]
MKFAAHGDGNVYWQDNNLYVEPESLFNLEGTLHFNKKIESVVKLKPVEVWCRIEIFKNIDTLGPIDAIPGLVNNFIHSKNNGCTLVCVVCGNLVMREHIESACKIAQLDSIEFTSIIDAQNFLRSRR